MATTTPGLLGFSRSAAGVAHEVRNPIGLTPPELRFFLLVSGGRCRGVPQLRAFERFDAPQEGVTWPTIGCNMVDVSDHRRMKRI
jgi:hypothetical protein